MDFSSVTDNPAVILDVGLNWVLSSRTSMYVAFQASMTGKRFFLITILFIYYFFSDTGSLRCHHTVRKLQHPVEQEHPVSLIIKKS